MACWELRMIEKIKSSIIIPVYNQWPFTQACLLALKKTLRNNQCEIIIVDNGSDDETKTAGPLLGTELFGDCFRYERFENNLNFGPASNHGADIAKGEFLIFLNNDTVPLEGWYEPLLDDFDKFPDIAATGPLLVYPECAPFGHQVQHLGVFVSPILHVGHLYEGIPADSPLAQKRRFFQIITAACMVMRKSLFHEIGKFDERYINGFEDVDLCVRLWNAGYKMTVNPQAKVIHYTSQTPGRKKHEAENFRTLKERCLQNIIPDWHIHLANDGMALKIGSWQTLYGSLPEKICEKLTTIADRGTVDELKQALLNYPLWQEGCLALIDRLDQQGIPTGDLRKTICIRWPMPHILNDAFRYAATKHDSEFMQFCMTIMLTVCKNFEEYEADAQGLAEWSKDIGLSDLEHEYNNWFKNKDIFYTNEYIPFLRQLRELTLTTPFYTPCEWAYTLWRNLLPPPETHYPHTEASHPPEGEIAFSILMPVYNPQPEHLIQAVHSVLAQSYPHWELCLVDDASPSLRTRQLIESILLQDSRIRVTYREKSGHIAVATNTALAMAEKQYSVLMEQDDLITPDALAVVARYITKNPEAILFFSDEDKITDDGKFFSPHFKNSKWDWELLYGQNFVNHLGVYRTDRMRAIGGFRDNFPGAQNFDMLLRYTHGVTADKFIHIPHVLYHWRPPADSATADASVNDEAVDSTLRALQEEMAETVPGATVSQIPGEQMLRVHYPLPAKKPLVSLVIDFETNLPFAQAQIEGLETKTTYAKMEILALYNEGASPHHINSLARWAATKTRVVLLPYKNGETRVQRQTLAAQSARGGIIGFLAKGSVALTSGWLEDTIALLCRDSVGAVGGKLILVDESVLHGGYLADATGNLARVFSGLPKNTPGYFDWNRQTRTVDALDAHYFFTHTQLLANAGGFGLSLPDTAVQDYCLRIADNGYRSVWTPFVEFLLMVSNDDPSAENGYIKDEMFNRRWAGKVSPCNPNLLAAPLGWVLNKDMMEDASAPSEKVTPQPNAKKPAPIFNLRDQADRLVDENFYYNSYPDVKDSGMAATTHYRQYGYLEGKNPSQQFDTGFYKKQYPALQSNPLEHYIAKGREQGALYKKPQTIFRNHNGIHHKLFRAALPDEKTRAVAWYLPQFHPIAENDIAWGNGFTEWTNVAAAQPRFDGHQQPKLPGALGFYDLRVKETLMEQINLARHAGIYGFCLHHYWFGGHKILRTPLEHWKNDPSLDFPFCLHWANEAWTKRWDGSNQDVIIPQLYSPEDDLRFIADIAWALRDKRYMRFQGKPMLGVYRPDLFPDITATIERWRNYCQDEKIGDIFLFASLSFNHTGDRISAYGFDGCAEFPPHGSSIPLVNSRYMDKNLRFSGLLRDYNAILPFLPRKSHDTPHFRGVMPGWDNSARSDTGTIFVDATPDIYQKWLETSVQLAQEDSYQGEKYLFINAWNEWAESAYLEPDAKNGYAVLNATAAALSKKNDLPDVLFICDVTKKGLANWLEKLLQANRQSPRFHPVVLSSRPVQSAGSFKGLAPLISMFASTNCSGAKRLFALHGYMKFHTAVMLSGLPDEQASAVCALCEHVVVHDTAGTTAEKMAQGKHLWTTADSGNDPAVWQLTDARAHTRQSLTALLDGNRHVQARAIEISVIVIPDNNAELSLQNVLRAMNQSPFGMEIIIPDIVNGALPEEGRFVLARWGNLQSYVTDALHRANGKYIWFFSPADVPVLPAMPAMTRAPFVDEDIVSVRTYADKDHDILPHLFGKDTVKIDGTDLIEIAGQKSLILHPNSLFALYRRSTLIDALENMGTAESGFVEKLATRTYQKGSVGVVPVRGSGS